MVRLKGTPAPEDVEAAILFQFLMVRLKVQLRADGQHRLIFQFLMVRLKGENTPASFFVKAYFNSLWFD